jgi:hypothetical protein
MRAVGRLFVALLAVAAALPSPAVEVRRDGDVQWVSGGVGADEREEMVLALPDHNLKVLTAAEGSGAFLAAVQVTVRAADGRTLFAASLDGPWLFARLPPGRYALVATWEGRTQSRSFTIPATGRRELFLYWAAPGVETLPKGAAS